MLIINHIVCGISGNFSNIDSQNDNILMIFRDQIYKEHKEPHQGVHQFEHG